MAELSAGVGIAAVERDTGINKETLRVWERRYGFPEPLRDGAGERLYPPEQVHRLRLVKRLLDAGHRPGRVVAAPPHELASLLQPAAGVPGPQGVLTEAPEVAACLALLRGHDIDGLRRALASAVPRHGLHDAVIDVFAPLTMRVGALWMSGTLHLYEEHLYSDTLQRVLCQAIAALPAPAPGAGPRVVLTTLPGDSHAPSLLMPEALLGLEGAACLSLGVQTPPGQLPAAATLHRADVVALSFSGQLSHRAVLDGVNSARELLPANVELWIGGRSRLLHLGGSPPGVRCLDGLAAIAPEVQRWRELLESHL